MRAHDAYDHDDADDHDDVYDHDKDDHVLSVQEQQEGRHGHSRGGGAGARHHQTGGGQEQVLEEAEDDILVTFVAQDPHVATDGGNLDMVPVQDQGI